MTPVEALEQVCNSLVTRPTKFIYVHSNFEANELADKLLNSEYPVCFMLPVVITEAPSKTGMLKSTFPLQAFFLDKQPETTTDFNAVDVESRYIVPMRLLAREFMHKLNEHAIIDQEGQGIVDRIYTPEYALLDAHLFGVFVQAQVPIMEGVSGCVH